jgi:uncharacterized cupin superfamily protein
VQSVAVELGRAPDVHGGSVARTLPLHKGETSGRASPTIRRVEVFNLEGEQDWDSENDREGFRHRATRVGARLGARALGAGLYELPPGEKTWPYHYTYGSEEWLLVVSGTPTLRGPDGERELGRGDVVVFGEGPAGAHQVINRSAELARVLILSSESSLTVVHYPDSGKVGYRSRSDGQGALLPRERELDYWEGEA